MVYSETDVYNGSCGLEQTAGHVGFEKTCLSGRLTGHCGIQYGSKSVHGGAMRVWSS